MSAASGSTFVVRCDDYEIECKSRAAAEARLEGIVKFGACHREHEIVERPNATHRPAKL